VKQYVPAEEEVSEGVAWYGWLRARKGSPWLRVCRADGMGQAARLLSAEADRRGIRDRHCCLTTGGVPRLQDGRGDAEAARRPAEETDTL
jgi:hypothetical protein